ncbi:hypothetical protein pEaSNUABM37_00205 [Erwinia phage pEa_SNUABM_37]|nr:hypothetical protein pEaSNUABM37_00205 [Erwinia phage pEa_SNUABM_37]QXO10675.1 hypothetical protein pEaSNUABM48_00205 [Erwinia phage pEa_SNUABM_48]
MRSFVKDPIAFIRNFPIKPYRDSEPGLRKSLVIDIVPYKTFTTNLVGDVASVMLDSRHHFGAEVVANYLERNYNEFGLLPYAEVYKGIAGNDYQTRIAVIAVAGIDFQVLQWRLQAELDHVGGVLESIDIGNATLL